MSPFVFRSSAAVAAMLVAASPALAQSLDQASAPVVVTAAPAAPDGDWTGFYAGGQLSYADTEVDGGGDQDGDALYGLHAGYQRDFGQYVLGGEASYDFGEVAVSDAADLDGLFRVGVRAGYDAGQYLPYVTAGYANATLSAESDEESYDGGFLGAGVSYAVTESVDLGAEVLFHRFDVEGEDLDVTTVGVRASYRF